MGSENSADRRLAPGSGLAPAEPLWRVVPTRAEDGRCLADFMMLIPGLGARPRGGRLQVAAVIREVCESYGEQVAFADVNYAINVLWVSVAAEPGLAGRVAYSIRQRVPEALLVGGQLGACGAIVGSRGPRPAAGTIRTSGTTSSGFVWCFRPHLRPLITEGGVAAEPNGALALFSSFSGEPSPRCCAAVVGQNP